jgi:hypothetical protein
MQDIIWDADGNPNRNEIVNPSGRPNLTPKKPKPNPKPFPDGPVPLRNPQSENSVASNREENEAGNNP